MGVIDVLEKSTLSTDIVHIIEERIGWNPQPNERGTIDIIWSCFLVLFVCVWAVMHHNVPIKGEGFWAEFRRKCRWATLAVCAPEMLTLFSVMQWNAANISVKQMRKIGLQDWSAVHAFYANAGGFILHTKDCPAFPINALSVHYLVSNGWIEPPTITRENIWDRSKADLFAKGFAIIQTTWLLVQFIARSIQKLAITPLELFTIAFILPTFATGFFWANKPQNVAETTIITPDWLMADLLIKAGDAAKVPYVDTPMDFVEKPAWEGWRRRTSLLHYGGLERRPLVRIPNDYSPPPPTGKEATFNWVISVAHAGLHLIGWNFEFPTPVESLIWRASSITLVSVMVAGGAVPVISTRPWFDFSFNLLWIWTRDAQKATWIRKYMFEVFVDFAYVLYIAARVLMFAEIVVSFRSLPASCYQDVSWSGFFPHVS
jgi:squalene monooxygenase